MEKLIGKEITTNMGIGVIDGFYYSDLGYHMVKVCFGDTWINYRVSDFDFDLDKII